MAAATSRKLFVNLAVEDLDRSVEFFTNLGFSFNPQFTDETSTCMLIGEDAYAMLLVKSRFKDFTKKDLVDATKQVEVLLAITADSREEVDDLVEKAAAVGGAQIGEPQDHGFMYERTFADPDGHNWSVFWMDPAALEQDEHVASGEVRSS